MSDRLPSLQQDERPPLRPAHSFAESLSIPYTEPPSSEKTEPPPSQSSAPPSPSSSPRPPRPLLGTNRNSRLFNSSVPQSQLAEKLKRHGSVCVGDSAVVVAVVQGDGSPGMEDLAGRVMDGVSGRRDQGVVFRGQAGSGKTACRRSFLMHLVELSKTPRKKSRVLSGATKMETVFAAFCHAQTTSSIGASRIARYTEYQYDAGGKMVGIKLLDSMLDSYRFARLPAGERNFNVFYQLLAGMSSEDRTRLSLDESKCYRYLGARISVELSRSGTQRSGKLTRAGTLKRALSLRRSNTVKSSIEDQVQTPTAADAAAYATLCSHLHSLGVGRRAQAQLTAILAAILHLGNIEFIPETDSVAACAVSDREPLQVAAKLLGVGTDTLENTLVYKTRVGKRRGEVYSEFLNPDGAELQRDDLSRSLYDGLVGWIVSHLNSRLCKDEDGVRAVVAVLDIPGWHESREAPLQLADLMLNWTNERLERITQESAFETLQETLTADGISWPPVGPHSDNHDIVRLLEGTGAGLDGVIPIVEDASRSRDTDSDRLCTKLTTYLAANPLFTSAGSPATPTFALKHYHSRSTYCTDDFVSDNIHSIPSEFVTLFRGVKSDIAGTVVPPSTNAFACHLFSEKAGVDTEGPKERVTAAHRGQRLDRRPSTRKRRDEHDEAAGKTYISTTVFKMTEILDCLASMQLVTVYCVKPFAVGANAFDPTEVERQLAIFNIPALARLRTSVNVVPSGMLYSDFISKYDTLLASTPPSRSPTPKSSTEQILRSLGWILDGNPDVLLGRTSLFLNWDKWRLLDAKTEETPLASVINARHRASMISLASSNTSNGSEVQLSPAANRRSRHRMSVTETDDGYSDGESVYGSEFEYSAGSVNRSSYRRSRALSDMELGSIAMQEIPPVPLHPLTDRRPSASPPPSGPTFTRRTWLVITWCLTFYIPTPLLTHLGGLKTPAIRTAWREKVALCSLIFFTSATLLFFIVGLSWVVCPPQKVRSVSEITSAGSPYVTGFGKYYDVSDLFASHLRDFPSGAGAIMDYQLNIYYGTDISNLFLRSSDWNTYCPTPAPQAGWDNVGQGPWGARPTDASLHSGFNPDGSKRDYVDYMNMYAKGRIGYSTQFLSNERSSSKLYAIIYSNVYFLNTYFDISPNPFPAGASTVLDLASAGTLDLTSAWQKYRLTNPTEADASLGCLNAMFYIGTVDTRNTAACQFSNYVLIAASAVLCVVIGAKFLAALQLGVLAGRHVEQELDDRFAMCLITAYTEGEQELAKTIDSLAVTDYDDRRKLLVVVCDGMVMGAGNDQPTPEIVLAILGVDRTLPEPPAVAYTAEGEDGARRYNRAKVYTGLYYTRDRAVPFMVIVKVGAEYERVRPGNRGKRDSQLVLMTFLNRALAASAPPVATTKTVSPSSQPPPITLSEKRLSVSTVTAVPSDLSDAKSMSASTSDKTAPPAAPVLMDPLQIEMRWAIERVVGVPTRVYEFLLMVDADTVVDPGGLNALVRGMTMDSQLMGLCGETRLSNEKASFTTMVQVYEYFISHYLSKAFESLFGTVTCLPGCFSMYRIHSNNVPVLASDAVLDLYGTRRVDTLHLKNLLLLGEDRFLTTVLLKVFPKRKTGFTPAAKCETAAPDSFRVLLSQRRRWINSTVHNLAELVLLPTLCGGFGGCLGMRFVVVIDLIATCSMPATILYVAYLVLAAAGVGGLSFPLVSIILIAAIYGVQIIVFLAWMRWAHIAWMILYLLSIPLFAFVIPLYSFWHFDDFSWEPGRSPIVPLQTYAAAEALRDANRRRSLAPTPFASSSDNSSTSTIINNPFNYPSSVMSRSYPLPPTHAELGDFVRGMLETADLMQVTRKTVRAAAADLYGEAEMTPRKAEIDSLVEEVLASFTS
ncbi:hypothetical protein HKX48_001179 [Thoreauomyces humboldtii]|nr:hypothetical protein HKX48_001179 [Thoreauomyces humboldtii]